MGSNKTYTVYMHTAPNKKVYIGITGRNPFYRWNNGKGYEKQTHFYNAIKKYGWDNFKHEILFDGLSKEEACEKEIELIAEYKSNNPHYGYNVANGGNVNIPCLKGEHFTEEHKEKIKKALLGKKKTKEHAKHNGEAKKGVFVGGKNPVARKINQYSLNGEFIKSYECIADALKELNLPLHNGHLTRCAKGKRKSAYGFCWKYDEGVS